MTNDLLKKIKIAGLVGRGGACYPTALKWQAVKTNLFGKKTGYIVINAAEGEPGVKKDGYILEQHAEEVINGVYLADKFLGSAKIEKIYFYINHAYYRKYSAEIKKILANKKYLSINNKLEFFLKPSTLTYISGEESTMLNIIEGKNVRPRLRPPFPVKKGLFGKATLINNVETFYDISLVSKNKYKCQRFYSIEGEVKKKGVYSLPNNLSIAAVLDKTGNSPLYKFFVQVGGEASGEVLNSNQLDRIVSGAGSIKVYNLKRSNPDKLLKYWLKFYYTQSCGNCTSCREGTYRLWELVNSREFDEKLFWELIENLENSSFCALGYSLPVPIKSYFNNILRS